MSFDDILFIEEDLIKQGFESGISVGEEFGKKEGFECGVENGYSFGMEIGYYKGFINIYKNYFLEKEENSKIKEQKLKLVNDINDLITSFITYPDKAILRKIRSKFKMLISNLSERQSILKQTQALEYNNKPKEEKPLCFNGADIDF
ncbi:hypothetical protein BCR32DRAFT_330265 [Anaeromyces robustus]|uniref:Uncharacterized protein n=1 Tax=Anaeromyces robustus TaxID=1754192 RepID=A0A1Y1W0E3_9FUNG|nr:hypothetical protein BCR32DRAFT_330265 [Anaeromyces robustus]|eukprot:ORX66981.1 hypothetical protein BCR32DRAFT_330265 [Anaeromyces robustus]